MDFVLEIKLNIINTLTTTEQLDIILWKAYNVTNFRKADFNFVTEVVFLFLSQPWLEASLAYRVDAFSNMTICLVEVQQNLDMHTKSGVYVFFGLAAHDVTLCVCKILLCKTKQVLVYKRLSKYFSRSDTIVHKLIKKTLKLGFSVLVDFFDFFHNKIV